MQAIDTERDDGREVVAAVGPDADDGGDADAAGIEFLDEFDDAPDPVAARVAVGAESVRVALRDPRPGPREAEWDTDVEYARDRRAVNEYALFPVHENTESHSRGGRTHATRLRLLFRESAGGPWRYGEPVVPPVAARDAPEGHRPTQVDGVTRGLEARRGGRRDSFRRGHVKITRAFVDRVETAFALHEEGVVHRAGPGGASTSRGDATAYELVPAGE